MTRTHFAKGQILFREGDPPDCVFRLLSGAVDILRELDGDPILLGTVGAGQFIGEMGVVENRSRNATARAANEVEVEILTPPEFVDQIAGSPSAARELIQRLSQRLREADDRIVSDEKQSGRALTNWEDADRQTPAPLAEEALPPRQPDLLLDDTAPFRLSRNHFMIEKRDRGYHVHDLCSTLGTIVNGEPIGDHFRTDDALLRAGDNEVIAGGMASPFVFSVSIL